MLKRYFEGTDYRSALLVAMSWCHANLGAQGGRWTVSIETRGFNKKSVYYMSIKDPEDANLFKLTFPEKATETP